MQRLVILWLTVGLLTRATHARHNITAALVALAPVLDNDQETALSMDGRNESSVLSVDWILLLVATAAQFLLVLHHRWIEEIQTHIMIFTGKQEKTQIFIRRYPVTLY